MPPEVSLGECAGVAESGPLPSDLLARLPSSTPGPPWGCRVEALLWWHRAAPAAAAALLPTLRGRRTLPITVGAFVRYLETPVGAYSEVFGAPLLVVGDRRLPGVSVPFIAVDSIPSVHGGRAHWSLPKVLASFTWSAGGVAVEAGGDGWRVAARAAGRGPRFPLAGVLPSVGPTGATALVRQRARARAARITVESSGPTLPGWLLPGPHPGLVLRDARMVVGAPR